MKTILIIGAGPAGSASAIFLANRGFELTLVDRNPLRANADVLKIGESLPPSSVALLKQLGVWEEFDRAGHLRCYGNKSYWGSDEVGYTDFIAQPPGYGWHIDRWGFEQMLLRKAQDLGARIEEQVKLKELQYEEARWRVEWANAEGQLEQRSFDFVIDASGRNSWLARRQGINRLCEDSQLALVTFLTSTDETPDGSSLIETTAQGWWYSANIPGQRMATAFLCKPDKVQRNYWLTEKGWRALLSEAKHTLARIEQGAFEWLQPPRFVSAESGMLESTFGPGWVAVGDAALSYDPIASHGIMMALVSARDAAEAIAASMQGSDSAFEDYDQRLTAAFYHYTEQRSRFYQAEQRFKTTNYW
ncbi:MAG: FAD-dependent monooxygenase [Bacteroidota bacterium]